MGKPDVKSAGKSKTVPFKEGEPSQGRHERRLKEALHRFEEIDDWFEVAAGGRLTLRNAGHHWIFEDEFGKIAEWWPSSAKLVFDRNYDKGIHCHDVDQLQATLERYWGI